MQETLERIDGGKMKLKSIIVPLITPFNKKEKVCRESVNNLIKFVGPFSNALLPTLSSGEGWRLNKAQWQDMVRFTQEAARKHGFSAPIIAGMLQKDTGGIIERLELAEKLEVDGICITTPFQRNITQKEIFEHFRKISKSTSIPIMIYNEEQISGNHISFETIKKICRECKVIGIKEASGDINFTQKLVNSKSNSPIFQGWENLCYASKGVDGLMIPLSNIEPKLCHEMYATPTKWLQSKINSLCKEKHLLEKDWFKHLKKELHSRGIIKYYF